MGCKKAQGFLERQQLTVKEMTDAGKVKRGRDEALRLARQARRVLVARGKKVVTLDMNSPPDDDTLAGYLLGPTGNLKAPTLRLGDTLLGGFSEEAYRQQFGG